MSDAVLSRRERQIMDLVYQLPRATAREIWKQLPDQPSYGTARKLLQIMVQKGHLRQKPEGRSLVYSPVRPRKRAARSAMQRLVETFYEGSIEEAVTGLLDLKDQDLTTEQLDRLSALIQNARNQKQSS